MNTDELRSQVETVAGLIVRAQQVVALTGAGMSVESGIPAFRGSQGLWDRYDPMEYASIDAFVRNPGRVWGMLKELDQLVRQAQPNPGHLALARLEELGKLHAVVTQNIDGLHQAAGSKSVVEFHGSGRRLKCLECGRQAIPSDELLEVLPPRCSCGGVLKPDVVLFGEPIPERAAGTAMTVASSCQVMLVIGTSATVAPASYLPVVAKSSGASMVEINLDPTPLTRSISDYVFHYSASQVLPMLVQAVEQGLAAGRGR